jgi:hypothetical protein
VRKLSRQHGRLPKSLFIQNVKPRGNAAVACGGFADVYAGTLLGPKGEATREVAIKVFRVFERREQDKKMFTVKLSSFTCIWDSG